MLESLTFGFKYLQFQRAEKNLIKLWIIDVYNLCSKKRRLLQKIGKKNGNRMSSEEFNENRPMNEIA